MLPSQFVIYYPYYTCKFIIYIYYVIQLWKSSERTTSRHWALDQKEKKNIRQLQSTRSLYTSVAHNFWHRIRSILSRVEKKGIFVLYIDNYHPLMILLASSCNTLVEKVFHLVFSLASMRSFRVSWLDFFFFNFIIVKSILVLIMDTLDNIDSDLWLEIYVKVKKMQM